jgi:ribosome-binding ATPase YchF (GTP1/OBG family)
MAEANAKGWVRMEGKDYVMQDGDVVEFASTSDRRRAGGP